jgi:mannose/cellobiose epimerase-like protein (N-acyl-D-glucosamine 2-epimerase family)
VYGGFAGQINTKGEQVFEAEKGLTLYARILQTFSTAYNYLGKYFWDKKKWGSVLGC